MLYSHKFDNSNMHIKHNRQIYDVFTLLGDVGGVVGVLVVVAHFSVRTISAHAFNIKAI